MAETRHRSGHEPQAVAVRTVLAIAAILLAAVLAVLVILHVVLRDAVMPHHAQIVARAAPMPPPPRLQSHPDEDLAAFRAEKNAELSGYAWIDATHTHARIPIARAMQIYARQHAAATKVGSAPQAGRS